MEEKGMERTQRSRHAGCPGSITAIRVDYGRTTSAFEPLDHEHTAVKKKDELRHWKQTHRLGVKPRWNESSDCAWKRFPDRANMRQLSAFQATKVEHNYRAQKLPTCYKETLFLPKQSKFQVDPRLFLGLPEKAKLVSSNVGGHLSRSEYTDDRDSSWNTSTQLDHSRGSIHHKKSYVDCRMINKVKHPLASTYASPERSIREAHKTASTEKRERRRAEEAQAASAYPRPLTMSNKSDWLLPEI